MNTTVLIIALSIVIGVCIIVMAILLYNFMQLLSTLNKRLIAVVSDILGNIDLSTPNIDKMTDNNNNNTTQISLEDVLDGQEESTSGFNPHNYDPFKEDNI
jgi:type II secretory pathway component PulK